MSYQPPNTQGVVSTLNSTEVALNTGVTFTGVSEVVSEKSDIMIRITSVSVNNLDVIAGYDIILVKN